ncbi:MAG: phosphotyrosine protein phosphatase [Microcystaceae cyanobacterium]
MNILFICNINQCRSPTAEWLYSKNPEFNVASAGIRQDCDNRVDKDLLLWADQIFVMERLHLDIIRQEWPKIYQNKSIKCLNIPDNYGYKEPALIKLLAVKLTPILGVSRRRIT